MAEAEQQQAEATELGSRLEDVDTKVDQLTAARTRKYTPPRTHIICTYCTFIVLLTIASIFVERIY